MAENALRQFYLIHHTKTNKPYITSDRVAYVFTSERDAKLFIQEHPQTRVEPRAMITLEQISRICYGAGAQRLEVCDKGETRQEKIKEPSVTTGYYNSHLNAAIGILKNAPYPEMLYLLYAVKFIVPAKIVYTENGGHFSYGIARAKDEPGSLFYIAFSDLSEYEAWESHNRAGGWQPLFVRYPALRRIVQDNSIILNPSGNQMLLTKRMYTYIDEAPQYKRSQAARDVLRAPSAPSTQEKVRHQDNNEAHTPQQDDHAVTPPVTTT